MLRYFLTLSIFFILNVLFAFEHPSDSSKSIIDRAAAIILIDEGKQYLNMGKTRDALTKFREAYVKDQYNDRAVYWIGRTHYNMSNYGYASRYAKLALELSNGRDGQIYFLLGEAYHRQNNLDSSLMYFELADQFLKRRHKRIHNVSEAISQVKYAQEQGLKTINYQKELIPGDVNSGYDDYSPVLTPDRKTLYFVSRRPDTQGGGLNPDDQSFYEDIYRASWNDDLKIWDSVHNNIERLNSDGFDAVNHITADGKTMYLTMNTSILDVANPTRSSDIAVAQLTDQNRWTKPKPIVNKTVNTTFFDGAVTLTADESVMYFVSDRRANKKGSEIYRVKREGNNWGVAEPLPDNINSNGNETTPFITPDGKFLFFSSTGHQGMGGYDIFVTENLGDNKWSDPINLGPEFNTVNNDTHFYYYKDIAMAYFASYRLQGKKASIDLYHIELQNWEIPRVTKKK